MFYFFRLNAECETLKDEKNRILTAYKEATRKWEESVNKNALREREMQSDFDSKLSSMKEKLVSFFSIKI